MEVGGEGEEGAKKVGAEGEEGMEERGRKRGRSTSGEEEGGRRGGAEVEEGVDEEGGTGGGGGGTESAGRGNKSDRKWLETATGPGTFVSSAARVLLRACRDVQETVRKRDHGASDQEDAHSAMPHRHTPPVNESYDNQKPTTHKIASTTHGPRC